MGDEFNVIEQAAFDAVLSEHDAAEVRRLLERITTLIGDLTAARQALTDAERERDEARAEVERLRAGPHCETCICGRRAVTQGSKQFGKGDGTISWSEHLEAYAVYASGYGRGQSAERINERGGFGYGEFVELTGRHPKTWRPR